MNPRYTKMIAGTAVSALIVGMACCSGVATPTTTQTVPQTEPAPKEEETPEISTDPEAVEVFNQRMNEYERLMAEYQAQQSRKDEAIEKVKTLNDSIAQFESEKPQPPKLETRKWQTFDKKYSVDAILVNANETMAKFKKADATEVDVPWEKLIAEDRVFIKNHLDQFNEFNKATDEYKQNLEQLQGELESANAIAQAELVEPTKPLIASIETELSVKRAAEEAARKEAEFNKPTFDLAHWQRVREGMTFSEVVAIIGQPSSESASNQIGDLRTVVYEWNGLFKSANCTFQNGKLVAKAQSGLN